MSKNRIMMFDVLRIVAIMMIVLSHVGWFYGVAQQSFGIPEMYAIGLYESIGGWGVFIFILISGAALEYTYGTKIHSPVNNFDANGFMKKRLIRIYPVYLFTVLLAVAFGDGILSNLKWSELVMTITGFYPAFTLAGVPTTTWSGTIDGIGWFIGTIVCLYFMYPCLSKFLKENGISGLFTIFLVAMFVRITIPPGFGGRSWYWFPLSRMLEFSLGIYIVQNGYYIKTINDSILIKFCSDLCFPIFLVHYFLQEILWKIPDTYNLNIITYVFVTMIVAYIVYFMDPHIKSIIEKYI